MKPPSKRTPLQQAVGLLSRREHSQRELRRKLTQRGVSEGEVDQALERLVDTGLQDELRFAQSLVRQRVGAGYGPLYLRAELATHQLSNAVIEQAMDSVESEWHEVASNLVQRRFPQGVVEPAQARRAYALLQRRGFEAECIRSVLRRSH